MTNPLPGDKARYIRRLTELQEHLSMNAQRMENSSNPLDVTHSYKLRDQACAIRWTLHELAPKTNEDNGSLAMVEEDELEEARVSGQFGHGA